MDGTHRRGPAVANEAVQAQTPPTKSRQCRLPRPAKSILQHTPRAVTTRCDHRQGLSKREQPQTDICLSGNRMRFRWATCWSSTSRSGHC